MIRECIPRLIGIGIDYDDAHSLRNIAMTLQRWHELECGTDNGRGGQTTYSVERDGDEPDSKPFLRVQYPTVNGYVDKRWPTPDRETGALKRLASIMARYPGLSYYVQGDPRGASLYILRPGDVPEGENAESYYSNGIAVYK